MKYNEDTQMYSEDVHTTKGKWIGDVHTSLSTRYHWNKDFSETKAELIRVKCYRDYYEFDENPHYDIIEEHVRNLKVSNQKVKDTVMDSEGVYLFCFEEDMRCPRTNTASN